MVQLLRGPLVLFALLSTLAGLPPPPAPAGGQPVGMSKKTSTHPATPSPSPRVPTSIRQHRTVVRGRDRAARPAAQGLSLGNGPLAPRSGGTLKGDPTLERVIDGKSHAAHSSSRMTSSSWPTPPMESCPCCEQASRRAADGPADGAASRPRTRGQGQPVSFDGTTVLDLRAGEVDGRSLPCGAAPARRTAGRRNAARALKTGR